MATRVGDREAKAHLSEYLDRTAHHGERILVERHGEPVAALVSIDDLRRLEAMDQAKVEAAESEDKPAREIRFRQAMADAGITVRLPTGHPVSPNDRQPLRIQGPPLSEQIIADRR